MFSFHKAYYHEYFRKLCFNLIILIFTVRFIFVTHKILDEFASLNANYITDDHKIQPSCSVWVINPDRGWLEPWRFLSYGLVHNNLANHLVINSILQIFFGIPLELSNGSWRIALIYISGIFLGGVGRQVVPHSKVPLAGASGK